jgi:hypothetical protein
MIKGLVLSIEGKRSIKNQNPPSPRKARGEGHPKIQRQSLRRPPKATRKRPVRHGGSMDIAIGRIIAITAVRLKVEENQLVDVFGEIGFHIDGLKGA